MYKCKYWVVMFDVVFIVPNVETLHATSLRYNGICYYFQARPKGVRTNAAICERDRSETTRDRMSTRGAKRRG
jgi:hypothetical protein